MIPVMATGFAKRLQDIAALSRDDPLAALAQCEGVLALANSAADVLQVSGLAVPLAVATLGQPLRAASFLDACLGHRAVGDDAEATRALHRQLAVVAELRGDFGTAAHERVMGIDDGADECRLAVTAAQLFIACGRATEAAAHLRRATVLVRDLPGGDATAALLATATAEIARAAETQARGLHDLLDAAGTAHVAATGRHADWRQRHLAWHHYGLALLLGGQPTKALAAVTRMIELENFHDAGPAQRFLSANLACRAQAMRGQFKVAAQAGEACRAYADAALREGAVPADLGPALEDLERYVAGLKPG